MKYLWRGIMRFILPKRTRVEQTPNLSSIDERLDVTERLDRAEGILRLFDTTADLIRREPK